MSSAHAGHVAVRLPRPVDLHSSLATLGRWGDDLIDRWDGSQLARPIRALADDCLVAVHARVPSTTTQTLRIAYAPAEPRGIAESVRAMFLTHDAALRKLARRDRHVAELVRRHPGHVPVLFPDPFMALVRSISAQQVNLAWASTIRARLAKRYGHRLEIAKTFVYALEPAALAGTSVEALRELQLTTAKARSLIAVAQAAQRGELRISELVALDDAQLVAHLTALPGIGRWTADWFLARTLGRAVVVAGDLGVRKAVARLYDVPLPSEIEVRRLTEHWGQAATMAQALALHDLAISPAPAPAR